MRRPSGIAAIILLLLIVLTLATARTGDPKLYPPKPGDAQTIWLIDNGFHTDLALPRAAVIARGGPLAAAARTSAAPWIMVGWGDAKFYEDASPWQGRLVDAGRAALGGRATTVHLEGVSQRPDLAWTEGVHPIALSTAGLAALMARIDRSFALDKSGAPIALEAPRQPGEAFFASRERFSGIHDCNEWTADVLSAAGLPMTPVPDVLPAGMWLDLKLRSGL